jgi:hypothetical protein
MTITINGGSTTNYWQGWDRFRNPEASATQSTITTGGTTVVSTIKDATRTELTTLNAILVNTVSCSQPIASVTNITPTICDTTGFPNVLSLQDGLGKVNLTTTNGDLQIQLNCDVNATVATAYLSNYTNGSLAKAINTLVLSAVGTNPSPSASFMNVYTTNPNTDNIKNPNLYTKDIIDLSPFANTPGGTLCLISPRHVITAWHVQPPIGSSVTFVNKNNVARTRTIIDATSLSGFDIWVGYLDSPITDITPYSVLPANAITTTKIPLASETTGAYGVMQLGIYGFTAKKRFPFGGGDNIRQMQLGVITNISGSNFSRVYLGGAGVETQFDIAPTITNVNDVRYPYKNWFTYVTGGDSGSPTFLPTGLTTATNTPLTLLLGNQSTAGTATSLSYYTTEINAVMNTLAGTVSTYALDQVNVSQSAWWNSFTTY